MKLLLKTLCAAALLVSMDGIARVDDAVSAVASRVAHPALQRGQFEQLKQVAGFRKPLRSTGRFVLARGRGIIWNTETPFASRLIVTPERLLSESAGGTQTLDAAEEPALRSINAILFDLIGGDVAKLQARFDVLATVQDGGRWEMKLTPKPGLIAQAFDAIELHGAVHVDRVVLFESNGDRSEITFSKLAETPALNAEEAARLAQ